MILDEILEQKREEHEKRDWIPLAQLRTSAEAMPPTRDFFAALTSDRKWPRVIAEFKRKSPSAGNIRMDADPGNMAGIYQANGAHAISVLTDEKFFAGDMRHLKLAKAGGKLPVLRKDFLLDARDVIESRLEGADAALLIVRILSPETLKELIALASAIGLHTLVETHNEAEMIAAREAGAKIIGVNHRDLDTLKIDLSLSATARRLLGEDCILVAESGIRHREDVAQMQAAGVDAILVGETLMKAASPGLALSQLARP